MQRLIYFDGVLYWFFGLQNIIYFLGPILFLVMGIPVLFVDVFTMMMFFIPTYYIATLVFTLFNHKSRTYVWAHIYESALAPYLSISALSELFLSNKMKFSVTPKGNEQNKSYFAFKVALPHIILTIISLVAMAFGISKLLTDVNYVVPVYLVNLFWLLHNILGSITAMMVCFEKHCCRAAERFNIADKPTLSLYNGKLLSTDLIDISMMGCALSLHDPLEEADSYEDSNVLVSLNDNCLHLPGKFKRSRAWGQKIIILFSALDKQEHTNLINYIFDQQQNGFGRFSPKSEHFGHLIQKIFGKYYKMVFHRS